MKAAYQTDIGQQRAQNQDRVNLFTINGVSLAVIADGIGGNRGGDVAAELTVSQLGHRFKKATPQTVEQAKSWFTTQVQAVNDLIIEKSKQNKEDQGMGTTLVGAIIFADKAVIAHIGDSQGYLLHGTELKQVTVDHSLVQELVKHGDLTQAEAEHHPKNNIITRAVGITSDAKVDINLVELVKNDQLLLCSDGLSKMVSRDEILKVLLSSQDEKAKCSELVDAANAAGGPDNITVLIVKNDQEG